MPGSGRSWVSTPSNSDPFLTDERYPSTGRILLKGDNIVRPPMSHRWLYLFANAVPPADSDPTRYGLSIHNKDGVLVRFDNDNDLPPREQQSDAPSSKPRHLTCRAFSPRRNQRFICARLGGPRCGIGAPLGPLPAGLIKSSLTSTFSHSSQRGSRSSCSISAWREICMAVKTLIGRAMASTDRNTLPSYTT